MYDKTLVTDILDDMLHATQKIQHRCAKAHCFDLNAETVYGLCQKHIKRLEETLTLIQTNLNQQSK